MKTKVVSFFVLFSIISGVVSISDAFADTSEITITPNLGPGSPYTVDVLGKVIFSNTDSTTHAFMTLDPNTASGTFSPALGPGETYEWQPVNVGEYQVRCMVHTDDIGIIIVQEASTEGSTTTSEEEETESEPEIIAEEASGAATAGGAAQMDSVATIPDWVRSNAEWWAAGSIGDNDFVSGIQYLIKEGIMQIPQTVSEGSAGSQEIPAWIKSNADWWAQGLISDDDFVKGIQYLVEQGIIQV